MPKPSVTWQFLEFLENVCTVTHSLSELSLEALFRAKTQLQVPTFERAIRARDVRTVARCARRFSRAGYTPHGLWTIARSADPQLTHAAWNGLLQDALKLQITNAEWLNFL